jgi:hypothetical protein
MNAEEGISAGGCCANSGHVLAMGRAFASVASTGVMGTAYLELIACLNVSFSNLH